MRFKTKLPILSIILVTIITSTIPINNLLTKAASNDFLSVQSSGSIAYPILPSSSYGGSINPSEQVVVAGGGDQTFTFTPNEGYHISDVLVDASSIGPVDTYTFTSVDATHTIKALFAISLLADSDFEASADSADLRANTAGQDWYESRNDNPALLTLETSNARAAIQNYGVGSVVYLTQELSPPQTSPFSTYFDINIDRIEDSGSYDRSGMIYMGDDSVSTNAPTGTSNERFVFMAFYDASPGDSGNDLQLRARTSSDQSWSNTAEWTQLASGLSYDSWYTIRVELDVPNGNYDVYIDGILMGDDVSGYSGYSSGSVQYVSFVTDNDARGDFFVDNVVAEELVPTYSITASADSRGSINPLGSVVVREGDDQTFIITPDTGYDILDVLVDAATVGAVSTYTFESVSENHIIHVSFIENSVEQVTVNVNEDIIIGVNNLRVGTNIDWEWNLFRTSAEKRNLAADAGLNLFRFNDYRQSSPRIRPCTSWDSSTSTGIFDWTYVDDLVDKIFAINGEPLVVLGWARDPMTNYVPPGMEILATGLPDPNDWAAYCAEWIIHFSDTGREVRFYEVTNEPWFYFGWNNQPELGYFKDLYDAARTAMKNEDPDILIGFDGSNRRPILDYWITEGGELDFVSFHKYDAGPLGEYPDEQMLNRAEYFQLTSTSSYYGIEESKQIYENARGIRIPAIMSEWNWASYSATGSDPKIQQIIGSVWSALTLRTAILEGLDYSTYYDFSASESWEQSRPTGGLGFGLTGSDNDIKWYPYYVHQFIGQNMDYSDQLIQTSTTSNDVRALGWKNGGKTYVLIVNKIDETTYIVINGVQNQLNVYQIDESISYLTPSVQTSSIDYQEPIYVPGYAVILIETS